MGSQVKEIKPPATNFGVKQDVFGRPPKYEVSGFYMKGDRESMKHIDLRTSLSLVKEEELSKKQMGQSRKKQRSSQLSQSQLEPSQSQKQLSQE
jgi:hypothetical protein